jgi:hypothetical protein
MLGNIWIKKSLSLLSAFAILVVYSSFALAAPKDVKAAITVTGQVTVNGQAAVSNTTVVSGSVVTTGTDSSAIISLSDNGRIELLGETSITLRYSDNTIIAMLSSGAVRVSNRAGVASTVTTKSTTVVGDSAQANLFLVDVGCGDDAKCSATYVETTTGLATMNSGSTSKQVAAGTDATSGTPSQTGCKPCLRPGSAPPVRLAGAWWPLIFLGVVPFFFKKDNKRCPDCDVIVISPIV